MMINDFLLQAASLYSLDILSFQNSKIPNNHSNNQDLKFLITQLSPQSSLKIDSRKILPGDVFISVDSPDENLKQKYIKEAQDRGAVFAIQGPFTRLLWTHWAKTCYPKQPKHCVGVTGTSGKSSVVSFVRQLWEMADLRAASIGSLGLNSSVINPHAFPSVNLTSPDAMILHSCLNQLAENQVDYVALEVSSHGLDQHRLDQVEFQVAAFTNFSHEHLDYHGTMEAYFQAKSRLFEELLLPGSVALINQDDECSQKIIKICQSKGIKILSFGSQVSDLRLINTKPYENGLNLGLEIFGKKSNLNIPLVGAFQAYNVLAALGLGIATGLEVNQTLNNLNSLKSVPGRMEFVGKSQTGGRIFVDYAHKSQALEQVLKSARAHTSGKIVVVFGCGGNRDTAKRVMMGKIAHDNAEIVIITDDNPRHENPASIRSEILKGCPTACEIPSRSEAISKALEQLNPEDICIIAGKGHEQGQIIGDDILPFNDREVVLSLINS